METILSLDSGVSWKLVEYTIE